MGFDEGGILLDGATSGDTANFRYRNNVFTGMTQLINPTTLHRLVSQAMVTHRLLV